MTQAGINPLPIGKKETGSLLESTWHCVIVILFLLAFFEFRHSAYLLAHSGLMGLLAITVGAIALGVWFVRLRYSHFPSVFGALGKMTAAGVAVYLIVEPPDFTLANPNAGALHMWVGYAFFPAVLAAIGAVFRPSLLLFPALYAMATRAVVTDISGYRISTLDIRYMMEMAQFLSLSAMCLGMVGIAKRDRIKMPSGPLIHLPQIAVCFAFVAIGLHLGNYFWSGYAKMVLGPEPWSWALYNPTYVGIPDGINAGRLPTANIEWLNGLFYSVFERGFVFSNTFVALTQLAAIIAILRLVWMKLISLAYDALHIGIWVFSGLFFWPWIWNNITILIALRGKLEDDFGWLPKVCCVLTILLGVSPHLGNSARLAWWNVDEFREIKIEAKPMSSDDWIEVPASYFLSHSYSISHGYPGWARLEGHYGSHDRPDYQIPYKTGQCNAPQSISRPETPAQNAARLSRFDSFLQAHHDKMLARENDILPNWYYWRSHHHPSNPFMYEEFNAIRPSEIEAYRLAIRSICVDMDGGAVKKRLVAETLEEFPVR